MKKNKIIYWSLLAALPLLAVMGCKKFLDRKPLQATLSDLNQGALESKVFGMYSNLRTLAGFSLLPWLDFHSIRDDDAQKGSDDNDGREIITEFDTYQYSKDDWAPNTYWNDHYTMINATNDALHIADSLKLSDAGSIRNVGEVCFFRAYSYFELVKAYGEVPLINFPIRKASDGVVPKSTVTALYAFIDSNLQVAAANLPLTNSEYGGNYPGRLTKGAAYTLWAQTYLFRQNWAQVIAMCNTVINSKQYSLVPEFSDIWRDAGENGPESIWEMQAYDGPGAASNGSVDYGSDFGTSQQIRRNGASVEWNLGWGWNTPTDKLVADWPADDPRKSKTILYSGQSDGGTALGGFGATIPAYSNPSGTGGLAQKYWNKKLYTGNDPAIRLSTGYINNSGAARWINHRILRYADVILMLAEAANETGDGATAAKNLELIRNRASGNIGPSRTVVAPIPFVNQAQMRTAIKNERRWEFAMEGYRFYDLVRWGDAVSVLGPLGYVNRARYYPIPQKAIDLSGGVLKQNPEW
ncbi:RagB/SusD family nutrient uptake outer membrane protein [Flavisolibacter ginsenosidimutans]|uniref:RagB/SusD family nutrient uptake outer membrane protein n=1 Tax=Flavisolibacter ginsenosidimutans TaxID=661481 RepID=A0A5B8UNV5_9BACT|nr:RagB/SusD family nutrient uptake outer membrane protein [Flavisolibacter ginsenosidimutans]QEC58136.1 RagB/SusD family nutrient uptake outer membrane protein [Flavisolibacter ginsenosidimutans]